MVTYKGYEISGTSGVYFVIFHGHKIGPFASYAECERRIDGIRF